MRPLHRLRPADRGREAHPLALERRRVLGPELAHRRHRLAHEGEAVREVRREEVHLFAQPARPHAEEEAAAREPVERRDLVRGQERIALGHEAYTRSQAEPAGHSRRRGERGEAVRQLGVRPGQLAVVGERVARRLARGNQRVLGHPERFEAALLAGAREVRDRERAPGREHEDADVHVELLTSRRTARRPWPS